MNNLENPVRPSFADIGLTFGLCIFVVGLYFLPTVVSLLRKRASVASTFWLNLAGGWTVVIWCVQLWRAFRDSDDRVAKRPAYAVMAFLLLLGPGFATFAAGAQLWIRNMTEAERAAYFEDRELKRKTRSLDATLARADRDYERSKKRKKTETAQVQKQRQEDDKRARRIASKTFKISVQHNGTYSGTCLHVKGNSSVTFDVNGTTPEVFTAPQESGSMVSCAISKKADDNSALSVAITRNGKQLAISTTTQPYGMVSVATNRW